VTLRGLKLAGQRGYQAFERRKGETVSGGVDGTSEYKYSLHLPFSNKRKCDKTQSPPSANLFHSVDSIRYYYALAPAPFCNINFFYLYFELVDCFRLEP